jgi:ankyrin repeat protein
MVATGSGPPRYSGRHSMANWTSYEYYYGLAHLWTKKADVNSTEGVGWTRLHMASRHGHFDIVHLLIDHGADVNTKMGHLTALHLASHYGYFDIVKALLERGANVHERTEAGQTPLPMAVQ